MPASKSTPYMLFAFHQSQATFPGLIHDGSLIFDFSESKVTRLLSTKVLSSSEIMKTLHGKLFFPLISAIYLASSTIS